MTGQHKIRQDKDYVSVVKDEDVATFRAMPDGTFAKYQYSVKFRQGKPGTSGEGKFVKIVQDMPLSPATYGFKDKEEANAWINASELWKD